MKPEQTTIIKSSAKNDNFDFNIKELLFRYWHYSWMFMFFLALGLFGAWLYLRYTPPQYSISASMLIRSDAKGGGGVFQDLALFNEASNKQNEILILKSRTLMARVVDSLGLQSNYFVLGNVKTTNIYKASPFSVEFIGKKPGSFYVEIHFADDNSFTIGEGKTKYLMKQAIHLGNANFRLIPQDTSYADDVAYKDYAFSWQSREGAAMGLLSGLNVSSADDMSNMLLLTYVTENPRLGADIINVLMSEYNKAGVEDKNQTNRNILSFIDDRMSLVEKQLDSVEKDLQNYKTSRQVIDLTSQSKAYFDNMLETNTSIRQQNVQIGVVELLENYLKDPESKLSLVPSTLGIQDPTLQSLTAAYNELITKRFSELQTGATVNSPAVKNLEDDIENARLRLLTNLANIKASFRNTITELQSQNQTWNNQIASVPQKERESRERSRQQEIKQSLYLYLLQKKEESGIAEASTIAGARVVDQALPTHSLVSPIPLRIYSIAIVIGLILPTVIVYLLFMLNDKVTTRNDISKVTSVPILGEIGHSPSEGILVFPQKSRSIVAEQIRILRSNFHFILGDRYERPVIMVTSSFSGEGKSFITTNLGAAMALSGKRTVILEFDLRKPKILAGLQLPKGQGLTNFLVGSASLSQLPQRVPQIENLYVISCGPVPPNPAEMLLTPRIDELFTWLRKEFDVVIIDTAPIGLVSDAVTLSKYADASLYIVRQRYTFKRQLNFIEDLYQQQKIPRMGLVVNDVIAKGGGSYYGYGGGNYGYGYGYGYGSNNGGYYEEEKRSFWKPWKKKKSKKDSVNS